ncbi:MAG: hypothetical protein ABI369_08330 [Acetobacteraceae bacterium]
MSGTGGSGDGSPSGAPQVIYASQTSVAMNVADLSVTFGHLRQVIDQATGVPSGQAAIEWMLTVTLSAPVAALLHRSIGLALEEYRKRYGDIPKDPTQEVAINMSDVSPAAT